MDKNKILRQLPKVDRLLGEPEGAELCRQYGKERTTEAFREALDALRNQILHREEGLERWMPFEIRSFIEKKAWRSFYKIQKRQSRRYSKPGFLTGVERGLGNQIPPLFKEF